MLSDVLCGCINTLLKSNPRSFQVLMFIEVHCESFKTHPSQNICCLLCLNRPELVVKKLRYYARYIVVCLLLNKMDLVKVLVKVLHQLSC